MKYSFYSILGVSSHSYWFWFLVLSDWPGLSGQRQQFQKYSGSLLPVSWPALGDWVWKWSEPQSSLVLGSLRRKCAGCEKRFQLLHSLWAVLMKLWRKEWAVLILSLLPGLHLPWGVFKTALKAKLQSLNSCRFTQMRCFVNLFLIFPNWIFLIVNYCQSFIF